MIQFLKYNWKLLTVAICILSAIIYTVQKVRVSFREQGPPDWLKMTDRRSPAAAKAACEQFGVLLDAVHKANPNNPNRLRSVTFLELAENAADSVLWCAERVLNAGFDPQPSAKATYDGEPTRLIGYYTAEGEPLKFTTRVNPNYPNSMPVTVHLNAALAPGESRLIVRREHHRIELTSGAGRDLQFSLAPMLWKRGPGLQVCGVYLGTEAKLTTYKPREGVVTAGEALVGWLDPNTPVTVAFARQ